MPPPSSPAPTGARAFAVPVRQDGDTTVVAPVGEIDIATIQPVREALEATAGPLRLDLSAVTFLDTTGLRLVVELERVCRAAHRPFSIVAGPADVQRIFDIAGLRDRLPFTSPDGTPAGGTPPAA